uniref:Uncharacterized protein n=1 Tax=Periophthalmus magnuspinnatus TaxID=409849 RepID=A0A3B3ZNJ3_9GOBI
MKTRIEKYIFFHNTSIRHVFSFHMFYSVSSQGLISRTKDFGDAHELIGVRLGGLRDRLAAADGLQPDILAKKSQADQFRVRRGLIL